MTIESQNTTKKSQFLLALTSIILGNQVLAAGTEGTNATLLGIGAGASLNATSLRNTFLGVDAGNAVKFVGDNTFVGHFAGRSNTGIVNTFVGSEAGKYNTTGQQNTFIGWSAGANNITANYNTFIGEASGRANTTGQFNSFIGSSAGINNTTGQQNTFIGRASGRDNTTGQENTFIGYQAGRQNTTGNKNVFIGNAAGFWESSSNKLYVENSNSSDPLIYGEFDNNLVGINGILGVGTEIPTSTLHVRRADGTAKVFVEETNATVRPRTLFELANAGNTKFAINNTDAGVTWAFTNSGLDFRISRQGSGSVELTVDNSGNLEVVGTSTATNHINSSSRALKHDFQMVDQEQILERVARLPISSWEYNKADSGGRHIGPVAEDFQTVFGLGDGQHISTVDTAGIALAAIQELSKQNAQLKAEKDQQIEDLQSKLANLESLVEQLLASGTVVATN